MNQTPPHEAKNRYLKDKSTDVTDSTLSNYKTTLNVFCDWLIEQGVENLNTLTSDEIQRFKEWRLDEVKTITLKTDMTIDVLDKHYDHAMKGEKMERREDYLVDM